jgi:hypothetical protein
MTGSDSDTPTWQLNGNYAQLQNGGWSATVDLSDPDGGISVRDDALRISEAPKILGVTTPDESERIDGLADAYARGSDLVALYTPTKNRAFRIEIYWRAARKSWGEVNALQFDLMVSVQTDRLGILAQIDAQSRIPADGVWLSGDAEWRQPEAVRPGIANQSAQLRPGSYIPCVVAALGIDGTDDSPQCHDGRSYIEAVSPSDFLGSKISMDGSRYRLRHRLLDEVMEKGVIRRVRVRGWLVAAPHSFALASAGFAELARDKLPLTT